MLYSWNCLLLCCCCYGLCCVTDIDECLGSVGVSCRRHGTCDGYNPAGSYTCHCNPGYKVTSSGSECTGNTLTMK